MLLVVCLTILVGCGADGETEPSVEPDGPRVANQRFEGDFDIAELTVEAVVVPLAGAPSVNFETAFGALRVEAGCNTYFGSFTLAEQGDASITVAGGSSQPCEQFEAQELAILEVLDSIDTWVQTGGEDDRRFTFTGPNAHSIVLIGR